MTINLSSQTQPALTRAQKYQDYYDGRQYDDLKAWENERDADGNYIPIYHRKPKIQHNMAAIICNEMKAMNIGASKFPNLRCEDETAQDAIDWIREYKMKAAIPGAVLDSLVQGAVAVTFGFVRGSLVFRSYPRTQAWPMFDDARELAGIVIRYPGVDDMTGKTVWYQGVIDALTESWCKSTGMTGPWETVSIIQHNFGFVPAIWRRNLVEENDSPEGVSLLHGLLDDLDELNYAASRGQRSLNYTADPQMWFKDDDPEKAIGNIIRSPAGSYFLGPNGDVGYLEIDGKGIELQMEFASSMKKALQEMARIVLVDPEKLVSGQLSGYALELAYKSMTNLADEIRLLWGLSLLELTCKILAAARLETARRRQVNLPNAGDIRIPESGLPWAIRALNDQVSGVGSQTQYTISKWHPWLGRIRPWPYPIPVMGAWPIEVSWGRYFKPSPAERVQMIQAIAAAKGAGMLSSATATRRTAELLDVDDVSAEVERAALESGLDLEEE